MKTYSAIILALAILICAGCSKNEDYREQYTGSWDFSLNKTTIFKDSADAFEIVNSIFNGDISVGELEDQIIVRYTGEKTITISIDEKGDLSDFPTNSSGGNFSGNSKLSLYLRWDGADTDVVHSVSGSKK